MDIYQQFVHSFFSIDSQHRAFAVVCMVIGLHFCGCCIEGEKKQELSDLEAVLGMMEYAAISANREPLIAHPFPKKQDVVPMQVALALDYVTKYPDYRGYHLLFFLKQCAPTHYSDLSDQIKVSILCSTLENQVCFNDWGSFGLHGNSGDDMAAEELLALGRKSLPLLIDMLDDRTPALLCGSEEANQSILYRTRRCDYAYRYIMLLLGREPPFVKDANARDRMIQQLVKEIDDRCSQ